MAEKGVDGVFLQRFLGLCDISPGGHDGNRRIRDEVGDLVQRAAEREGRVHAIMCVASCSPKCPRNVYLTIRLPGMTLVACQPSAFKRSSKKIGTTCYEKSVF